MVLNRICVVVPVRSVRRAEFLVNFSPTGCVELRMDYLRGPSSRIVEAARVLARTSVRNNLRVIVTMRSAREGGRDDRPPHERRKILNELGNAFKNEAIVDFELEDLNHADITCEDCLASIHYSKTPVESTIKGAAEDAFARGASLFKAVLPGAAPGEIAMAANLVASFQGKATAFTLGPYTVDSRVIALRLGAPFVFASHPEEPLPGIPSPREIMRVYKS